VSGPRKIQQGHGFGEGRPHREKRIADGLQRCQALFVMGISPVEQGDERAGVNEYGAHAFARRARGTRRLCSGGWRYTQRVPKMAKHVAGSLCLALFLAKAVVAQTLPPPRLNSEQRKRAQALSKLVDEVFAQKHSAPADVVLSWQGFFIAANKGLVYVPYTIGIAGSFSTTPVAMYVRVLAKDAKPADYDASKTSTIRSYLGQMSVVNDTKDIRSGYVEPTGIVAEDVQFFEPPKDGRLSRGIWLQPGEYNMFIALQEKGGRDLPKTAVLKQPIVVPDLSKGLALSSVIIADSVEPVPPSAKQRNQLDDPYAIAGTKITPAASTRLRKTGEITVVFYVYNPTPAPGGRPDLQVDYTFYAHNAGVEQPFNRSVPQLFNAQTLPPDFNPAVHQIMGGESVPLASFPSGDYRLEVKVADKIANTTAVASATFSVLGQ
jgi:hypothetical protein